jgi:RimK family alpha-L-glutamate ligase
MVEKNQKDDILPDKITELCVRNSVKSQIKCFEHFEISAQGQLLYEKEVITDFPKVAFFRGYNIQLYTAFESRGVRVVDNDYCVRSCWDKVVTHKLLEKHGVNMPKTLFFKTAVTYEDMAREFGSKFIVKQRFGREGKEVALVNDEISFENAVSAVDPRRLVYQEFISESFGRDLRVLVLDGRILTAFYRINGSKDDFRSNISCGGSRVKAELTQSEEKETVRISKLLHGEFISVDYLLKEKQGNDRELVFCEANTNPGVTAEHYALGYDPGRSVFDYLTASYIEA